MFSYHLGKLLDLGDELWHLRCLQKGFQFDTCSIAMSANQRKGNRIEIAPRNSHGISSIRTNLNRFDHYSSLWFYFMTHYV